VETDESIKLNKLKERHLF